MGWAGRSRGPKRFKPHSTQNTIVAALRLKLGHHEHDDHWGHDGQGGPEDQYALNVAALWPKKGKHGHGDYGDVGPCRSRTLSAMKDMQVQGCRKCGTAGTMFPDK